MPKIVECWECSTCKAVYEDREVAERCEKTHTAHDNLEIDEIYFAPSQEVIENNVFPKKLLISDKTNSGSSALYRLELASSIETFYQESFDPLQDHITYD